MAFSAELAFDIPPVPVSLNLAGQSVEVTLSGKVQESGSQSFHVNLRADLSDFQNHLTPILKAELDKSDRCGERISVEDATLMPAAPSAHLTVKVHVEKWVCIKAFGKENAKKLLSGNGVVEMTLAPHLVSSNPDEGALVRLDSSVDRIDADGTLGEVLRSGTVGDILKDKIREALLKSIRKATDLAPLLPEQVRPMVTIRDLSFADSADRHLALELDGSLRIPDGQLSSVRDQLRKRK
jgi:hypothetical protein